jgi:chromosome segregation ATPase
VNIASYIKKVYPQVWECDEALRGLLDAHAAERAALVQDRDEWRDVSRDWRYRAETAERDVKDARGDRAAAERALAEAHQNTIAERGLREATESFLARTERALAEARAECERLREENTELQRRNSAQPAAPAQEANLDWKDKRCSHWVKPAAPARTEDEQAVLDAGRE